MKETGIIMSGDHPKLILDGIKSQTRRVIKPQPPKPLIYRTVKGRLDLEYWYWADEENETIHPVKCPYGQVGDRLWCKQNYLLLNEDLLLPDTDILYRLTDDRICAILTMEVQNGRYKTDEWSPSQAYPNLPQRGLHGGVGWSNLLTNKIQRLWAEGIRGLVSASRTQQWQGLSEYLNVSSESQGYSECSSPDMYGFSWDAAIPITSDTAFRRQSGKQSARQSMLGDTGRKLDGQEDTRAWERGRQAPNGKTIKLRDEGIEVGNREGAGQSAPSCENSWDVAGWHISSCPSATLKLRPSIHMPRWASRILLEITDIRVERVQEISTDDANAEGLKDYVDCFQPGCSYLVTAKEKFEWLWDSLNAKYGWDTNCWVWVISFKVVK